VKEGAKVQTYKGAYISITSSQFGMDWRYSAKDVETVRAPTIGANHASG
jgi:hypothetical protein